MDRDAIKTETDVNQRTAADPGASVWVSASAGTGKTSVLIARLKRLLLQGANPARILCLTYTNAAAAEMQNRLYVDLKNWVAMDEPALASELQSLTGRPADKSVSARARQLFTLTLETKGGLKINTIHGFCERLLHRFPLEAGIAPDFSVLDEALASELQQRAVDRVLRVAAAEPQSALGLALTDLVARTNEGTFRDLLRAALRSESLADDGKSATQRLARALGLETGGEDHSVAEMAQVMDNVAIDEAVAKLQQGKKSDMVRADALTRARDASGLPQRVAALRDAFLTKADTPLSTMITKDLALAHPNLKLALEDARDRFFDLWRAHKAHEALNANAALSAFREAVAQSYGALKDGHSALDYDDLIARTGFLLKESDAAQWVLYKLDGGIDHILVDEAQDTSPAQWRVINALADEFFSGEGAREAVRTVFAVGDEKQSIYRFQGAEPEQFAEAGRSFEKRAKSAKRPWSRVPFNLSFRSSPTVLEAVDRVFGADEAADGVSWRGERVLHHANRHGEHGLVEVWPVVENVKLEASAPFAPLEDDQALGDAASRLARRIARQIQTWRAEGAILPSRGTPIEPGDILILVRKRHPFALPMIRALKEHGIPVAGADRMRLTEQLAVMDLMAFGAVMLAPQDDLSLACVLKSPLIGLDDDALFTLGYGREGSLWDALRSRANVDQRFGAAAEKLTAWQARVDFMAPYEFFSALLEENNGAARLQLIACIGPDAADAIDEFLNAALAYDELDPPSMQGFLHRTARADAEIKRDMEQGRNEVRIMTVHGAKGLESGIVFLPDTCTAPQAGGGARLVDVEGADVWIPPGAGQIGPLDDARRKAQAQDIQEYHRLLYVAMTRARDQLYVCGFEDGKGRRPGCWYDLVFDALESDLDKVGEDPDAIWRMAGGEAKPPQIETEKTARQDVARPNWASEGVAEAPPALVNVTPSAVLAEPGGVTGSFDTQPSPSPSALADQSRYQRGRLIHTLLEHLPEIDPRHWDSAAAKFIELNGKALGEAERNQCVDETLELLRQDTFAPLFEPGSMAEVPIVARLGGSEDRPMIEISGQIDRLVVRDNEILIADYKTNRPPPKRVEDTAPAYLAQLAAYRAALVRAYPDRQVRCAIVWTAAPRLMPIPHDLLDGYEERLLRSAAPGLDAPRADT